MELDYNTEEKPIGLLIGNIKSENENIKKKRIDEYCKGDLFEYEKVMWVAYHCMGNELTEEQKNFHQMHFIEKQQVFDIKKQKENTRQTLSDKKLIWDTGISEWTFKFRKLNLLTFSISLITVGFLIYDHLVTKPKQELKLKEEIEKQVILYHTKIEADKKRTLEIPNHK
ncbi:MAG TPA: hypothetical protein VN922_03515 [Bacteroidia bacterium]|nr:hypothetical protein [Bacteroidia bacterium]